MKNRILLLVALISVSASLFAQYDPSKVDRKASDLYNKAFEAAQNGNYKAASDLMKQAIGRDGKYVDAYLSLAGIYTEQKDYVQSAQQYEKAFSIDSNYTAEYLLPYSINLAGLGKFSGALAAVDRLLLRKNLGERTIKAAQYRKRSYEFALDFEARHKNEGFVFTPQNLGDGVNTAESEYFPSISIDGTKLIFTRLLNKRNEDFFGSEKVGGVWQKAQSLPGDINTPDNEGAQNVSTDGTWLLFTGCYRPDGSGNCDLYLSYLMESGWSEPVNLGNKVNTDQWDSQPSLSPDKRDLYFSSSRPGGFGGRDLWVTHLQPNGRWSEAENMGPKINTAGEETEPFIHTDNQTLYFASNGHLGYGGSDIFMIRKNESGSWGEPQNLGYPINTIDNDGTLVIASDAVTAYFSSNRYDGKGGHDIYSFPMRPSMRPAKTLWIKGQVFDKLTTKGLPSTVELIDLNSKQVISKVQTDGSGNYLITLPVGRDYAFNVNRKGYLFYSDNYSLKDKSPDSTYQKNIPLQPIEVNAAVVLKNIFFDYNQYAIKNESIVELDRLVQFLKDNPAVKIQVGGHTDNIGNAADNLKLSGNRAKAVLTYLQSNGIAAGRAVAKGFGATVPVAPNTTEEGRALNRRTEIKITGK